MIKPTVGRVVWYWEDGERIGVQPRAALITWVHSDVLVNLVIFDHDGKPWGRVDVPLHQDGDGVAASGWAQKRQYATWMPYQKGQAAKCEALEKEKALALEKPLVLEDATAKVLAASVTEETVGEAMKGVNDADRKALEEAAAKAPQKSAAKKRG